MKKLFTLLTLLVAIVTGAQAAVTYSGDAPATKTFGTGDAQKTFLDVANTKTNATIENGNVGVFSIDMNNLVRTWKPEWLAITSGSASNNSYSYSNITKYGFLATVSNSSYDAYTTSYGYAQVSTSRKLEFYVTGITGLALLQKDNNSAKKTLIQVQEYNNDGTLGEASETSNKTGNTAIHILEYAASTLSADKYYKITLIGDNSSSCYIYQIRFTPGPAGQVDPVFSLTPEKVGIGETAQIQVGSTGNLDGISITAIESSDNSIATVTSEGVVTGVAAGTATITFSTSEVTDKYNATTDQTLTVTVVDKTAERTWDFTAPTAADMAALKANPAFQDNQTDYISNANQWDKDTDHAFEAEDGTDISVAEGLLFGRASSNLGAGSARYYYKTNDVEDYYVYLNNSSCYVKVPDVYAGQRVIITMKASGGRTFTAINTTAATASQEYASSQGITTLTFVAAADGTVKISNSGGGYSIYKIEVKAPIVPVTITAAKYATFVPSAAVTFEDADVKGYAAVYNSTKGSAELVEVTAVPAGTPVVVYAAKADTYDLNIASEATAPAQNNLKVSDGTVKGDMETIYGLKSGTKGVGFYPVTQNATIAAGKVYLQIPASEGAREFIGFGGEEVVTGIDAIENGTIDNDAPAYNLAGQKVGKGYKGIVIINGKKVVK